MRRSGMVRNVVGSLQQKYGQVKAFGGQLDTGKVASAGQTMMAGAGGFARGDYAGAGKAMLMQEAKSRVGSKIAQLGGGAKLGGGYAAAATGAMQGIANRDICSRRSCFKYPAKARGLSRVRRGSTYNQDLGGEAPNYGALQDN